MTKTEYSERIAFIRKLRDEAYGLNAQVEQLTQVRKARAIYREIARFSPAPPPADLKVDLAWDTWE